MNLYELLQQLLRDQKGQGTKYVFRWFSWSDYYGDGSYGSWVALCEQFASILGIDNETAKGYAKLVYDSGVKEYNHD